jgi:hypothetical protein
MILFKTPCVWDYDCTHAEATRAVLSQVAAFHFLPPGRAHLVTLVYPSLDLSEERSEVKLKPVRQALHALLNLIPNRPALRASHALMEDGALALCIGGPHHQQGGPHKKGKAEGGIMRLRDVHAGLSLPGEGVAVPSKGIECRQHA